MKPIVIETLAAIFGILGALLLSTKFEPAWGFAAFLVSNIGWMAFSVRLRAWRMFVQQVCFLLTSLIGLWNWWLGPLVLG
ncbi:MAG: hypothetical protein ACKVOT_13940 [Polaromonas sp.]